MSLAYILLQCDEGKEKEVLKEIKQLDEVKEAYETFGPYDAVVKIESNSPQEIKQVFNEKIHGLYGIRSTLTLLEELDDHPKI
ncbi:MAG: Lrp/AsnC ligand binding domain-containing protein [Nitrosopumilus sp.]|jgi:DNA-binding Lrp family transcriptional regulator|nr:Lrp/AsnC ligand binding domain-containing protein [Nitrosopumilus sp.]MDH3853261.1 Lrp/AsnC ligand binding domain-containing protein [Nitrosopumilus sp.]